MLNMKKGLAIVLAAATALTFAPVSTLGLQGVVEAQADTAKSLTAWTTAGSANVTATETITVDSTKDSTPTDITLSIKNDGANAFTNVTATPTIAGVTVNTDDVKTLAAGSTANLTFTVAANATKKASTEITVETTDAASSKHTYKFNLVITNAKKEADDAALADANGAKFQNVDDTYQLRDVNGTTATIKPSWVISGNTAKTQYSGADLWYTLTSTAPTTGDLTKATIQEKTDLTVDSASPATKANIEVDAAKGSLTLKRTDSIAFAGSARSQQFYLSAYKLNDDNNAYTLVGVKAVTLAKYNNAAYGLKLDQSAYTMSLNTVTKTDALNKDVKIAKADGTYMTATDQNDFLRSATWTVSGADIAQETTAAAVTANIAAKRYNNNIYAVYAQDTKEFYANAAGSTQATVTITSTDGRIAQTTVSLTVLGTSQYALLATVDGSATAGVIGAENAAQNGSDNPVVLDTKVNKTYDLASHIYKNTAMDLSYESSNSKNTVNPTTGLVTATTATDSFYVKVTGKVNGNIVAITKVYFKVNALPFDTVSVTGVDKDQATTLNQLDYTAVSTNRNVVGGVPTEQQLAASQIKYVQIEVTGNEQKQVTEALNIVSTGGAVVTASLVGQSSDNAFADVTSSGVITLNSLDSQNRRVTSGVAVIKLVSAPSANNVLTTSYIFVVVDKADAKITAQPAYKIGTCSKSDGNDHESKINFGDYAGVQRVQPLDQDDDLLSTKTLYKDAKDINKNFVQTYKTGTDIRALVDNTVYVARSEGKTEKVLISYNTGAGTSYQIVSITSVAGLTNTVTKIENATTGKVIYSSDMGTVIPQIVVDGVTTLKVTLAYPIDKNGTTANIDSSNMYTGGNGLNQSIFTATKEKVQPGDTANTFYLYPTAQGTQVVWFNPSGDISETDHSIVHDVKQDLAVTYRANAKPSKVTGLKVSNKKGAKVSVKFDAATNHNMKYWVQKKIGKKVAGKSVSSNKATLSVKKGATVKVRVKAYYYDAEGNKQVGAYSGWKTLKTDKK